LLISSLNLIISIYKVADYIYEVSMNRLEVIFYDPKKYFTAALVSLFVLPLIFVTSLGFHSDALTINSARDCDDNAVIRCGALNFTEMENRSQQAGAAQIYSSFGISSQDIANMRNMAVEGSVTSDGQVLVNGNVVATNAITAGRQNIAGSTAVTHGGVTFYRRPPSVSFVSNSLPAFVVMDGGRFQFAIIASCGNPVVATPVIKVPQPKPQPQPAPQPKPQPQPAATPQPQVPAPASPAVTTTVTNNNTNNNSNVNNNSVTVQAPPVQPVVTQAVAPQPVPPQQVSTPAAPAQQPTPQPQVGKTLPNTGPAGVVGLTGLSTVMGTVGHLVYQRRKGR
jgi:hypothetical protein